MRAAVLQTHPRPGDPTHNLDQALAMVRAAGDLGADLAVLPETFLGGAPEKIPGPAVSRLAAASRTAGLCLVAGLPEDVGAERPCNSSVILDRGEIVDVYRKIHLFSGEKTAFLAGDRPVVLDLPFARVGISICYDLIFPEFIRGLALKGATVIVNSTHWHADAYSARRWGWHGRVTSALAATRALENGVHVVMAARAGGDDNHTSLGHSCIAAPSGDILNRIESGAGIALAEFDPSPENPDLQRWRGLATYLPDRRVEIYRDMGILDPPA